MGGWAAFNQQSTKHKIALYQQLSECPKPKVCDTVRLEDFEMLEESTYPPNPRATWQKAEDQIRNCGGSPSPKTQRIVLASEGTETSSSSIELSQSFANTFSTGMSTTVG